MAERLIHVYADWKEVAGPKLMGYLAAEIVRGKEVFSFEYDKKWLQSGFAQDLDPDLQLFSVVVRNLRLKVLASDLPQTSST